MPPTRLGITVENVTYAPDGVADYTLMLILMAIRNVKHVVSAVAEHDFRLGSVRGRDLCDMTVGVVGGREHRRRGGRAAAGLRMPGARVQRQPDGGGRGGPRVARRAAA